MIIVEQHSGSDDASIRNFIDQHPFAYNDFASVLAIDGVGPPLWVAHDEQMVGAAMVEDDLAMLVAGSGDSLRALAAKFGSSAGTKLVVSGRHDEILAFVDAAALQGTVRPEHLMMLTADRLRTRMIPDPPPLRVATEADIPLLTGGRVAAVREEHGIDLAVDADRMHMLSGNVRSAVANGSIALWIEDGQLAFTAQLVSRTDNAACFSDLFVDPELRGEGRATRALIAFCDWLMQASEHVILRVGTDNTPAVRLYERVGFTTIDAFASFVPELADAGTP